MLVKIAQNCNFRQNYIFWPNQPKMMINMFIFNINTMNSGNYIQNSREPVQMSCDFINNTHTCKLNNFNSGVFGKENDSVDKYFAF